MPISVKGLMPCLWFDTQAEAAANHYVSIFPKSKLGKITRYGKEGKEIHGKPAGSVLTVEFEIESVKFIALNGGPQFKFDEAVSWQVVPTVLPEMLQDPNAGRADRAMKAMLQMRKLDIAALQRARNG